MLHCQSRLISQPRQILCSDIRKPSLSHIFFILLHKQMHKLRLCCILLLLEPSIQCAETASGADKKREWKYERKLQKKRCKKSVSSLSIFISKSENSQTSPSLFVYLLYFKRWLSSQTAVFHHSGAEVCSRKSAQAVLLWEILSGFQLY